MTIFSVLTLDNWSSVIEESMFKKSKYQFLTFLYLISWIFIGNYILLNLFLAILLDNFTNKLDDVSKLELEVDDE